VRRMARRKAILPRRCSPARKLAGAPKRWSTHNYREYALVHDLRYKVKSFFTWPALFYDQYDVLTLRIRTRPSFGGSHGSGKVSGGRSLFAIHSMLVGSWPSNSINSLTANQASSKGTKRSAGKRVSCVLRTHSRRRLRSPFELYVSLWPPTPFGIDEQHAEIRISPDLQVDIDTALIGPKCSVPPPSAEKPPLSFSVSKDQRCPGGDRK
jgi:hypothetical protein